MTIVCKCQKLDAALTRFRARAAKFKLSGLSYIADLYLFMPAYDRDARDGAPSGFWHDASRHALDAQRHVGGGLAPAVRDEPSRYRRLRGELYELRGDDAQPLRDDGRLSRDDRA